MLLANVENRVPGMNVVRKCLLLKLNYIKEGGVKIEVVKDLYPTYGQCKGGLVSKNKHLVLLSNEQSLHAFDMTITSEALQDRFLTSDGRYDVQGQSAVKFIPLKNNYFMLFCFRCQLFRLLPIP